MKLVTTLGAAVVAVFVVSSAVRAQDGSGQPPPDPDPVEPQSLVNARAQSEIVLRAMELDDLLLRAAGRDVPCDTPCRKVRDSAAIEEFIGNTCRVVRSLGFSDRYSAGAEPAIAELAIHTEAQCDRFDETVRELGPLNPGADWRSAVLEMESGLPALIEPAGIALAEVAR